MTRKDDKTEGFVIPPGIAETPRPPGTKTKTQGFAIPSQEAPLPFRPSDRPPPPSPAAGDTQDDAISSEETVDQVGADSDKSVADDSPLWLTPSSRSPSGFPPPERTSSFPPVPSRPNPPIIPLPAPPRVPTGPATPRSPWSGAVGASALRAAWTPETSRGPAPEPQPKSSLRRTPSENVQLIWFEPRSVPRVRQWAADLVAELEFEPFDPRHDIPDDEDRHVMFGVLTEQETVAVEVVDDTIAAAINERGRFTPPLCVLSGYLRLAFDELERLKASLAVATSVVAADPQLKSELDRVREIVSSAPPTRGSGIADKLLRDVRGIVQRLKSGLPARFLDDQTERLVLEQRHFERRTVFGEAHLQGSLGSTPETGVVPAYLPEPLAPLLPLVPALRVRILAEVHPAQDAYETHPAALRVIALGRVLQLDRMVQRKRS